MVLSYHYTGFEAGDEDQSSLQYLIRALRNFANSTGRKNLLNITGLQES